VVAILSPLHLPSMRPAAGRLRPQRVPRPGGASRLSRAQGRAAPQDRRGREEHDRQRAEFGFDEKWARMKALPDGEEKHAVARETVEWLFR
jgi:hypothetical protein